MNRSQVLLLTALLASVAVSGNAFAKKLDLSLLPGKYDYVPTSDTSIDCTETLTVTYDPATASLESEMFHFSNIGGKLKEVGGMETMPDHAGYTEQFTRIRLTSDSVIGEVIDHAATTMMPMTDGGPFNAPTPGAPQISDSWAVLKSTRLKFNVKTGYLKLTTTSIDKLPSNPTCAYQKIRN